MTKATMDIEITFREGADVPDEAYRYRKVLIDHNIEISNETYTQNSVTFTILCNLDSFASIASLIDNKGFDVNEAVVDLTFKQDLTPVPIVGTVKA